MVAFLQCGRKKRVICLLLQALLCFPALADTIHFKDGSVTVCREKAWEENDKVKCAFYGTTVDYPKDEVDRIETGKYVLPEILSSPEKDNTGQAIKEQDPTSEPGSESSTAAIKGVNRSGGPVFYDPRRPHKYWASETSRHDSYDDAINAMAKQFNRAPEWVKTQLGNINSLTEIHEKLSSAETALKVFKVTKPVEQEKQVVPAQPAQLDLKKLEGLKFYDPRREKKYWVLETSRHTTLSSAIDALAMQHGRSPEWITTHMGDTNDLGKIHKNLAGKGTAP